MVNCECLWLLVLLGNFTGILLLPLQPSQLNTTLANNNRTDSSHQTYRTRGRIFKPTDRNKEDTISSNVSDILMTATARQTALVHLPLPAKPRGFDLPKARAQQQTVNPKTEAHAQNYFKNYIPQPPHYNHEQQSYFSLTEDPILVKLLSHHAKQFQSRPPAFDSYDSSSILGSGDFGILRGGTFYSDEEQSYLNEGSSDIYYGEASNTQTVTSTEGFIQKYTYPEEQFAQFRDFAELNTPADSAFSQYVVVYAAKNASKVEHSSKPKNIFEQLQEIDKEKELEQKKRAKNMPNSSITKLKLVKTKQMEKKWTQRQPTKIIDDDPLIALS